MKSLVIFGIQNDLVSFVSPIDFADSCEKLKSLVDDGNFDRVYYYEIDIYNAENSLTDKYNHKICQAGRLGANINWRALEITSGMKLDKFVPNIKNIKCTISSETWMEMPYIPDFDESDELYLAGNLSFIAKSVASWENKSRIKIIPDGLWLGNKNWLFTLCLEYYGIDFYTEDQSTVRDYKKKYLKQYYSTLKQANI